MKIILSRKGFDSQYGKLPNLILPDGRLLFFPIPDKSSGIKYTDIQVKLDGYQNVYDLLMGFNQKKIKEYYTAHLDPDLYYHSLPERDKNWKPLFGQSGAALGHLRKEGVGKGDIFLFFGTFRKTAWEGDRLVYERKEKDFHMIFGYLCVGDIIDLNEEPQDQYEWTKYHPHYYKTERQNWLFVASDKLKIAGKLFQGAKVLDHYTDKLRLSITGGNKSIWKLPNWFYPFEEAKPPLTYHLKKERWTRYSDHIELQTVGKGQEFVLDADKYPEWKKWVINLIN